MDHGMRSIDNLDNSGSQGEWTIQYHMSSQIAEDVFFCVDNIGHYRCNSQYRLEREHYYSFLILCTVSGCGQLEYGGRTYVLDTKKIVFINAYEHHCYYPISTNEPWEFYWLHFDGPLARKYLELILGRGFPVLDVKDNSKYAENIASIFELKMQKNIYFEANSSLLITKMLTKLMIASNEQGKTDSCCYLAVNQAIDYIKRCYNQDIKVSEIAEYVHLSTSHLIRTFKQHTNCSPYEYLTKYRIMVSKMHLTHSNLSVAEIAKDVGFPSVNNYISTFKRLEGSTPYQYKKSNTFFSA